MSLTNTIDQSHRTERDRGQLTHAHTAAAVSNFPSSTVLYVNGPSGLMPCPFDTTEILIQHHCFFVQKACLQKNKGDWTALTIVTFSILLPPCLLSPLPFFFAIDDSESSVGSLSLLTARRKSSWRSLAQLLGWTYTHTHTLRVSCACLCGGWTTPREIGLLRYEVFLF